MFIIIISNYKNRIKRLSTDREVITWKSNNNRRENVVIIRYELKNHLIFRIKRASKVNSFDLEKISNIINIKLQPYRINKRK